MASSKPKVLILGGLGFIGRNLMQYLHDNQLVSRLRIADKVLPDLARLNKKQSEIIKSSYIDCKQVNLAKEAMVNKAFDDGDEKWDFVINLAGETRYSETEQVYKENVIDVSVTCAKAAGKRGVKRYIEVSTAQVYDADKKPSAETDKIKPWTKLAEAKYAAEQEIRKIQGLNYVIVRPAIVYGPGDIGGVTPRIITAAVYKELDEKMEFLWDKDLKMHTVHVNDVVAALWHLCSNGTNGEVYNLADSNDTDQGGVNKILESIFKIKTGFYGSLQSKIMTGIAMKTVAETANEKHLKPWSDLCKKNGITNTPLTPYLDEELLYNNPLSVDGSKITKTGFSYKVPKMSEDLIKESINYFVDLGIFPKQVVA